MNDGSLPLAASPASALAAHALQHLEPLANGHPHGEQVRKGLLWASPVRLSKAAMASRAQQHAGPQGDLQGLDAAARRGSAHWPARSGWFDGQGPASPFPFARRRLVSALHGVVVQVLPLGREVLQAVLARPHLGTLLHYIFLFLFSLFLFFPFPPFLFPAALGPA